MRLATTTLAAALCALLFAAPTLAQPIVDGVGDDAEYEFLGAFTQAADRGFGDWGLIELKAFADATDLYIYVGGTTESNFNSLYIWLDIDSQTTGTPSGTALTPTSGGFDGANPTLELPTTEWGIRLTHGGDPDTGFINVVSYAGTSAADVFLGSLAVDGTASSPDMGNAFEGASYAYSHVTTGVSNNPGNLGFEIKLELADLGISGNTVRASAAELFQLFTAYANDVGSFFSTDVIPEVPGIGAIGNLGGAPDFTMLAGTQATTSSALPVELTAFEAQRDGDRVVLTWATSSETNNAGFDIELRAAAGDFQAVGFVAGQGTTTEAQTYRFTTDALDAGTYTFRLRQVDFDGAFEYSPEVELALGVAGTHTLSAAYPNPFAGQATFSLAVAQAQDVEVSIYDALGRRVATLFDGAMQADQARAFTLDAADLPSGLYVIRAQGTTFSEVRRVTVAR
ncbi:MAG: T9SS type A sorting domain-containing protein [Bacteroidota bacterium]